MVHFNNDKRVKVILATEMEKGIYRTTIIYTNVLKQDQRRVHLNLPRLVLGQVIPMSVGVRSEHENFKIKVKRTIM